MRIIKNHYQLKRQKVGHETKFRKRIVHDDNIRLSCRRVAIPALEAGQLQIIIKITTFDAKVFCDLKTIKL